MDIMDIYLRTSICRHDIKHAILYYRLYFIPVVALVGEVVSAGEIDRIMI